MRKSIILFSVILLVISMFSVSSTFAAKTLKIAIVDVNEVVENYDEFKQGLEELKADFIEKQTDLDTKMKALAEKEQNLKKQASVMDDAKREALRQELETEFKTLQATFNQYQTELSEKEAELFNKLEQKVLFVVEDIAKDEKYDIVMKKQATLYYDKDLDITKKVQEKLYN